ncbi:MAG: S8 family peptidase, partial [Burkholderiales bacterium]
SRQATSAGAPAAWALGARGQGVWVGLLDSGVRATHAELVGRVAAGWDATGGDGIDRMGHGTMVAGLVAAARDGRGMVGLAPEAGVLPVRVLNDAGLASDAALSAGVRYAAARASILNLSLAATTPIAGAAIREAVERGTLVVVAAGNRGAAAPDWPARFAREAWAHGAGSVIVVGAVDAQNRIAAYSNRAGDTAAWYLVAPGSAVLSASNASDTAYGVQTGTSMAAPAVSGAAALLQSRWPRLTGGEVASILLATARDLGAPGVDPVYGRGLLDVEAAMRPVGPMTTRVGGADRPLSATGLMTSPATVAVAQAVARTGLPVMVLDAYRRDFQADLSARVAAPPPQRVDRVIGELDRRMERLERRLPGDTRLAMSPGHSFSVTGRDDAGAFWFGAGAPAREWFGVAPALDVAALANPYAALAPRGAGFGRAFSYGETTLRAGVLGGTSTEASGLGWAPVTASTAVLEATHRLGETIVLGATLTRAEERGAWLGAVGSGAFAADDIVRTDALQLAASARLAPGWTLAGSYARGHTPAHRGAGLVGSAGASASEAASLALVRDDAVTSGDQLSVAWSLPMRTRSGDAQTLVQTGLDAEGNAVLGGRSFSLVPTGREQVAEIAWRAPLDRRTAMAAVVMRRWQPNHDAAAAPDTVVAVRWRRVF